MHALHVQHTEQIRCTHLAARAPSYVARTARTGVGTGGHGVGGVNRDHTDTGVAADDFQAA